MKRLLVAISLLCALAGAVAQESTVGQPKPPIIYVTTNGVYGPGGAISTAGSTTMGIQEAINALPQTNTVQADPNTSAWNQSSGGGRVIIGKGEFVCSGQILIPDNGPFNLKMEGVGKVGTLLRYTGTTNFVQTAGTNVLLNFHPLNITMKDMGFLYERDTVTNMALWAMNINEGYFENCLFAPSYQLTNSGVGASLIHLHLTPPHPIGTIGVMMDAANIVTFQSCEFDMLPYGLIPWNLGIDQLRMRDCMFENNQTNDTLYVKTTTAIAGAAQLFSCCSLYTIASDAMIQDCHFMFCDVPMIVGGPTVCYGTRYESCNYTVVNDSGFTTCSDNFDIAAPKVGTISGGAISLGNGGNCLSVFNTGSGHQMWNDNTKIYEINGNAAQFYVQVAGDFSGGTNFVNRILTKTANFTLTASDSGATVNNSGAAGARTNTLPTATAGLQLCFDVETAQILAVVPAGTDTIRNAASVSSAGVAGGAFCNTIGNQLRLKCVVAGKWVTEGIVGTWTLY